MKGQMSSRTVSSSTGSPQGCVLPPLLFIMYTDSFRVSQEGRLLVKFSDDSVLVSLLSDSDPDHGPALTVFVEKCDDSYLDLNVTKTKEMIIDFRHNTEHKASVIHRENVHILESYKYLGV